MTFPAFRPTRHIAAGLLALLLTACSGLLPQPPALAVYRLPQISTGSTAAALPPLGPVRLDLRLPQAEGLLRGDRIVVLPDGNRVSIYQGARWDKPIPELLRERLATAVGERLPQTVLLMDNASLAPQFSLRSRLSAFQSEIHDGSRPVVVATLVALLVDEQHDTVLAQRRFHVEMAADAADVPTVVETFGMAAGDLADAVVTWAAGAMAAASHPAEQQAVAEPQG